ncbi:hypothetical protein FF38_05678 [Lucilia cuprina]|uniref:Uncharacterized protein n=1 Tax=Lucilia cuprina TaxID=7375 RepID=A0A0L0CAM9_LUCCU|nr:hypothetical protein FF38_05678 [Lucilia cuprina]
MLRYLCLVALIASIYSAPVNDTVSSPDVVVPAVQPTHINSNPSLVTTQNAADKHEQEVVGKKLTTKSPEVVEILESGLEHQTDGSYSFHYRGSDGSFREETAVVKNPGTDHEYLEITGAYSFFDADGKEVVVHYKADDKGFVPVGNNIPDVISVAARENSQLPPLKKLEDFDD